MSYILDALRKADAERERDPARGIHAQPAATVPVSAVRKLPAWTWPAAMLATAGVAAFLAWDRGVPVPAPVRASQAVTGVLATQAAPALAPSPVILPVAAPVAVAPAPAAERMAVVPKPASLAVVKAAAVAAPAAAAGTIAAAAAATAGAGGGPAPAAAPLLSSTAVNPQGTPAAAAPALAADRVYAVAELPPDVQRELPKLAISGGVHSDNAAQRMLIVGGQVMTEGAVLAPGVVLEQIRPRSAVLRFRSWRYSVGY